MRTLLLVLALCCPMCVTAAEVRVLSFTFNLPDTWAVEIAQTGEKLFATGSREAYTPPIVMADGCAGALCGSPQFKEPFPPNLGEDWKQMGCLGAQEKKVERESGIVERRWVCSRVTVEAIGITVGVSLFQSGSTALRVTYLRGDEDAPVDAFLDSLGASMKIPAAL